MKTVQVLSVLRTFLPSFALALLTVGAQAQDNFCFRAELDGSQQVPPVTTGATGHAFFVMDPVANTLWFRIYTEGLSGPETAAHIHGPAAPGANAGVLFPLPAGSPKEGIWNFPEVQEASILAGLTYVNIHTAANPGGEIRGQILVQSGMLMEAQLDGGQEVPPAPTTATGRAFVLLDLGANQLDYWLFYEGLSAPETAAHIHGYTPPGANAGVQTPLALGSTKVGTWNYPAADEVDILNGLAYFNVHSSAFPGGEIRGQIVRCSCLQPSTTFFCAPKTGLACGTPAISATGLPSASAANGFVISAGPARSCRAGILLHNTDQIAGVPFAGGRLCVRPQGLQRAGPTNTRGTQGPNCDGVFSIDMNTFAQGGWVVPDCAGAPSGLAPNNPAAFLRVPGVAVFAQFWGRDTLATGTFLSDGVGYIVLP